MGEEKASIEDKVCWIVTDIENLFMDAETEEETHGICNALCKLITIVREKKNEENNIAKISKEIQEVLMHGK